MVAELAITVNEKAVFIELLFLCAAFVLNTETNIRVLLLAL